MKYSLYLENNLKFNFRNFLAFPFWVLSFGITLSGILCFLPFAAIGVLVQYLAEFIENK